VVIEVNNFKHLVLRTNGCPPNAILLKDIPHSTIETEKGILQLSNGDVLHKKNYRIIKNQLNRSDFATWEAEKESNESLFLIGYVETLQYN